MSECYGWHKNSELNFVKVQTSLTANNGYESYSPDRPISCLAEPRRGLIVASRSLAMRSRTVYEPGIFKIASNIGIIGGGLQAP